MSNYSYQYDEKENCVIIKLDAGVGTFDNSDATSVKNYSLRYHLIEGMDSILKVTVNDQMVSSKYVKQDTYAAPFAHSGGSVDGDVISIDFTSSVNQDNIIKIYLR